MLGIVRLCVFLLIWSLGCWVVDTYAPDASVCVHMMLGAIVAQLGFAVGDAIGGGS